MALITVPILLVALSTTVLEVCFLVMRIGLSPWAHHYGVWEISLNYSTPTSIIYKLGSLKNRADLDDQMCV
jgi:hypothetical protein